MRRILYSISLALIALLGAHQVSAQGISQLQQFTSTTSPSSAITQQTYGKALRLTGLESLSCLGTDGNGIVGSGTCTGGGGTSFGKSWELLSASILAPTSSVNIAVGGTATSTFAPGLSAGRQIAAPYFHATSSTATSTFAGGASLLTLLIGGDHLTELCGTGITCTGTSLTASLGTSIVVTELASGDFGDFSCNGTTCTLDVSVGGSGGGTFSTTTSTVAGQLINYPNNTTDIVAIGSNSTTTAEFYFDPNTLTASFGTGGAGDSEIELGPSAFTWTLGFDDTDDTFAIASSTVLGTLNALTINKSLVTTLSGGLLSVGSSTLTGNATTTLNHAFGTVRVPLLTSAMLLTDANGLFAEYAGSACGANNYTTSISVLGAVTCGQVSLTAGVSGDLPFSSLAQLSANSVLANATGATADGASVATSTLYGTGTGGFHLAWNNGRPEWVATSTCVQLTGSSALCDGNDATGAGGSYPFTPLTTYGELTSATTSPIWVQNDIYASSTVKSGDGVSNSGVGKFWADTSAQPFYSPSFAFNESTSTGLFAYNNEGTINTGLTLGGVSYIYSNAQNVTLDADLDGVTDATFTNAMVSLRPGSASAPGINFIGNETAGLFGTAGGNYIGFATEATERARVTSTGFGIGTSTPWGTLSVASPTYGYNAPLFVIATSTDSYGKILFVTATTTDQTILSSGDVYHAPGARVAIGSDTYFGYPLVDPLYVPRVNTGEWLYEVCSTATAEGTQITATVANTCGRFGYRESTQGVVDQVSQANATGGSNYFRLRPGTAGTTAAGNDSIAIDLGAQFIIGQNVASTTPIFETAVRLGGMANATSTNIVLGLLKDSTTTAEPTEGFYFFATTTTANGNWLAVCNPSTGTTQYFDTGVPTSTVTTGNNIGFNHFRIEMGGQTASAGANFYVRQRGGAMKRVAQCTGLTYASANFNTVGTLLGKNNSGLAPELHVQWIKLWYRQAI